MRLVKAVLVGLAAMVDVRADERANQGFVELYWENVEERGVAGVLYSEYEV